MNDQLKMLASSHHDGNVTWWLMDYATPKGNRIIRELEALVPREQWDIAHHTFLMLESRTIDIEVALEGATKEESGLAVYWSLRNGSVKANLELFETVVGAGMMTRFWTAYDINKGGSLSAPDDVQAGSADDPNA